MSGEFIQRADHPCVVLPANVRMPRLAKRRRGGFPLHGERLLLGVAQGHRRIITDARIPSHTAQDGNRQYSRFYTGLPFRKSIAVCLIVGRYQAAV